MNARAPLPGAPSVPAADGPLPSAADSASERVTPRRDVEQEWHSPYLYEAYRAVGRALLQVPRGKGRHFVELAHHIEGVDIALEYRAAARAAPIAIGSSEIFNDLVLRKSLGQPEPQPTSRIPPHDGGPVAD